MDWKTRAWPLRPFEILSFPHYAGQLQVPQDHDLQAITQLPALGGSSLKRPAISLISPDSGIAGYCVCMTVNALKPPTSPSTTC